MDKKESDVHFVKVLKQRGIVSILLKINLSGVSSVLRVKRPLLFLRELIGSTFVTRKKLFFKQLKMLLMEPACLRNVANKYKITATTVHKWIFLLGSRCKSTLQVIKELSPEYFGILGIDGKVIKILGKKHTLLLAVDIYTQDIVHFLVVSKESLRNFRFFICQIKEEINYPLQGAVIDLQSGLTTAIREFYPSIPI